MYKSWWKRNYVMAFSICYWAYNYNQGKTKLSRKSENSVADDRVLKFFCMTPTYVMLNPQCDVTGNTRMIAQK